MEQTPDDVLVLTQERGPSAWLAVMLLAAAGVGAGLALVAPARSIEWALGAFLTCLGVAGAAFALVSALRPARLTITPDGIDLWRVFGARAMAWPEIAAIGHTRTRIARGAVQSANGVRIALLDGTDIDLPPRWSMSDEDLIELLVDAWQGFTSAGGDASSSPVVPTDSETVAQPALVSDGEIDSSDQVVLVS